MTRRVVTSFVIGFPALFAIIFGQTNDKEEIKQILQLKTKDYITFS